MSDDERAAINVAVSTQWRRRSDDSLWSVSEFNRGMGAIDGFTMRRIRLASEPQPEGGFQDEKIHVADIEALRRDFAVADARIPALREALIEVMTPELGASLGTPFAIIAAAPEMLALLRESPQYGCSIDSVKRCMFVTADGVECWYHRRAALLARIDAARKEGQ